jgi:hypothetical protein
LGGTATATETVDGDEPVDEPEAEQSPVEPHVEDAIAEPPDNVHALPSDQPEGATEPAANGTARVPER